MKASWGVLFILLRSERIALGTNKTMSVTDAPCLILNFMHSVRPSPAERFISFRSLGSRFCGKTEVSAFERSMEEIPRGNIKINCSFQFKTTVTVIISFLDEKCSRFFKRKFIILCRHKSNLKNILLKVSKLQNVKKTWKYVNKKNLRFYYNLIYILHVMLTPK